MKILLSSIPSDSHTWNLVYMQLFLEELGHEVMNLGACVPINLLESSAMEYQPDMVVISSINGHGNIEGVDIATVIQKNKALHSIPLVIGGKIGTQGENNITYETKLKKAGFHGVFSGHYAMNHFVAFMNKLKSTLLLPVIQAVA